MALIKLKSPEEPTYDIQVITLQKAAQTLVRYRRNSIVRPPSSARLATGNFFFSGGRAARSLNKSVFGEAAWTEQLQPNLPCNALST